MARGESIHEDFFLVGNSTNVFKTTTLDLPSPTVFSCGESRMVLTDGVGIDTFKNDVTSVIFKYPKYYTTVQMVLQQNIGGTWTDVDTLDDDFNGTFYPLSFIVDEQGAKYIGYQINWKLVYDLNGFGVFRVKTNETGIFGVTNTFTGEYCLSLYHSNFAEGTVKIEFYSNNLRGDITDPLHFLDFSNTNWYNSIRLCGMFGFDSSEYEREFVEYDNGQRKWVKDEQSVNYLLKLKPINATLHNFLKTDVLQSDEILITDYNKNNANKHIQTNIIVDGSYEPKWNAGTKTASVEVKMKLAYNNLRKKRC